MIRSVPLAVRRAEADALDAQIKAHRPQCARCADRKPCAELWEMKAHLREMRADIKMWFAPGPDQEELWPTSG